MQEIEGKTILTKDFYGLTGVKLARCYSDEILSHFTVLEKCRQPLEVNGVLYLATRYICMVSEGLTVIYLHAEGWGLLANGQVVTRRRQAIATILIPQDWAGHDEFLATCKDKYHFTQPDFFYPY